MLINLLKSLVEMVVSFVRGKEKSPKPQLDEKLKSNSESSMKSEITLNDLLTASGKYPKRVEHPECTQEVVANATKLLEKVNALLDELGFVGCKVSSGFRPSDVNAKTPNAAKKSLHQSGHALDIEDANGQIKIKIKENSELLKKYGLWMEDPLATPSWCHLDDSTARADRLVRIFKP